MGNRKNRLSFDEMMLLARKVKEWKYYEENGGDIKGYRGDYEGVRVGVGKVIQRGFGHVFLPLPDTRESYFILVGHDRNPAGHYITTGGALFSSRDTRRLKDIYSSLASKFSPAKHARDLIKSG